MKDVLTVDALSTILLLTAIEAMYPGMRWVHVFVDNARYHHAKLVQAVRLAQPGRRIKLHFIPAYCPHLNPIERLWGLMHKDIPPTTSATAPSRTSAAQCCTSCATASPGTGALTVMRSPTTSRIINPTKFRIIA